MKPGRKSRYSRFFHKWLSIILSLFILIFVASGIIMNHRGLVSGIDVPRKFLLKDYRYNNWNNAAVKASCFLDSSRVLLYGNIGIWLTDTSLSDFQDFNQGFPKGIDNRKVFKVCRMTSGDLFAGTLFGLFHYNKNGSEWVNIPLPVEDMRVVDLLEFKGKLLVLTRSHLLELDPLARRITEIRTLPSPRNYDNKAGLFKTLWIIHSGELGGFFGKLFVDLMGLLFAFLCITGIIYWLFPKWIRRRKKAQQGFRRIRYLRKFSLKWHNRIGVYVVLFMLITTVTGMFLRPPLLIAIANARVPKIPFTLLDDHNPWYDQLRRIHFDEISRSFLVGTNRGIFQVPQSLQGPVLPLPGQPPVSVMGINVFERYTDRTLLMGSFNGLFLWDPASGRSIDFYNPGKPTQIRPGGPPLSENMTAGYINLGLHREYVFDYNRGVESRPGIKHFPPMPETIRRQSPMSLWNLALEFHTGRYYSFLLGKLYILFIPLFGIAMMTILLTGFVMWWKLYRKR